jgi:pilus assembly protein CpaE
MAADGNNRNPALAALLIAPDRELAEQFALAEACRNGFEVISELKTYPTEQTLDIRLRQLNPDVVLLDVGTNPERALELIHHLTRVRFDVSTVALDRSSRPDMVLRALRCGASEYLHAPFDEINTAEATSRLLRLRKPDTVPDDELGRVVAFSSVKPGSGASTLALQSAFALKRGTGARVLLVDLDLTGGAIGFCLKLDMSKSIADAALQADALAPSTWTELIGSCEGVDVLPAPALPSDEPAEASRLQAVLDYARTVYDWVVVDLPAVPLRTALIAMSQADRVFLVSTAELASLHLARRAVKTLVKPEYQELKFTLHRKLLDKINLEALASIDNQRVRGEVRQALISLIDGEPTLLSSIEKQQICDEVLDEVFGLDRWSRCCRTRRSPTFWSTATSRSTSSAKDCWS